MGKMKRLVIVALVLVAIPTLVGGAYFLSDAVWSAYVAPVDAGTVVGFYTESYTRPARFRGSGCVIGHRGDRTYILTACHVVLSGGRVVNEESIRVERCSLTPDLALVSVPGTFGTSFTRGGYPQDGRPVWVRAHYEGTSALTLGIVSNQEEGWIDSAVMGGFSGGAVTDHRGRLVGIVISSFVDIPLGRNGLNICEPSVEVDEFLAGEGF